MKKSHYLIYLLIVLAAGGCSRQQTNEQVTVNTGNSTIETEIATKDMTTEAAADENIDTLYPAYILKDDDKLFGYIDSTGKFVIEPVYDQATDFSDGVAVAHDSQTNEYIMIDRQGNVIYRTTNTIGAFQEGYAVFEVYKDNKSLEGYIDTTGTIILPAVYNAASPFEDGKAYVYTENQIQQIDTEGNVLNSYILKENDIYISDFRDGYIVYNSTGSNIMEAMNYRGEKIPLPVNVSENYTGYSNLFYLGENIFAVMQKTDIEDYSSSYTTPYALFDAKGKQLTDYIYYDLSNFSDGMASATDDDYTYFLDTNGRVVNTLPKFQGRGTLTLKDDIIKAEIDNDFSYETTAGKVIYETVDDIILNDTLTLKSEKFKSNKYVVVHYPILTGLTNSQVEKQINEELYKIFVDGRKDLTKEDNLTVDDNFEGSLINNILLIYQTGYDYPMGAAHGMPIRNYYPIDLTTGKIYELSDLFKSDSSYVDVLSAIVAEKVKEDSAKEESIYFEDTEPAIAADQYFYLDEKNLYLYFYPYDIAPYAAGFPEFKIPFDNIRDIINYDGDFYKALNPIK